MLSVNIKKQFRDPGSAGFQLQIKEEFASGFTVLFGPSGAGKSTILDCIAGLQLPDTGRIALGEKLFYDGNAKMNLAPQRRGIAYVFQSLALFPHLSVEKNIGYGIPDRNEAAARLAVEQALQTFHITELRRRKPRELSGGEQQRVALARSLATDPDVLLLDEPLTGMDAKLRASILQDLREWNASRQIPILYVTHNREEVDAIGERVIALAQGRVVGRGIPSEVLDAPRKLVIAQAAGFENVQPGKVANLKLEDGVMDVALSPSHIHLEVPLGTGQPGESVRVAIRAGDILIATERPQFLSAQNILPGIVESMETRGTLVLMQVNAGVTFLVHVTPAAVRNLFLKPGVQVWLVIKTHSCHVVSD